MMHSGSLQKLKTTKREHASLIKLKIHFPLKCIQVIIFLFRNYQ